MAATKLKLSTKVDGTGKSQVIVKLTVTRSNRPCFKSGVYVRPEWFNGTGIAVPKAGRLNGDEVKEAAAAKSQLTSFIARVTNICNCFPDKDAITHKTIEDAYKLTSGVAAESITANVINEAKEKKKQQEKVAALNEHDFSGWFNYFIEKQQTKTGSYLSTGRKKGYRSLLAILLRFEQYTRLTDRKQKNFKLDVATINKETIEDFFDYMNDEKSLSEECPKVFKKISCKEISDRGHNVTVTRKKELKAFFHFLNKQKITSNNPLQDITVGSEKYGTPYFLTPSERDDIAAYDLTAHPRLAVQRDIFIFQCWVGCRVSDLMKMTGSSVIGDTVQYVPRKTKDDEPVTVTVPLKPCAVEIIKRYAGNGRGGKLLPFVNSAQYNIDIKDIFKICGIDRVVTILNKTTGEEEHRPLYEIASSHLARRTFIGNAYKQVSDPNIVGKMSGHVEGSKAFARYRDIDDDMLRDVINKL